MNMKSEQAYQMEVDGQQVTIRPIESSDIGLEREFIDKLSTQAKYYRFLGGVSHLSDRQLKELCEIDFDHRMAFIASTIVNGQEEEIGVSRYAAEPGSDGCEFAVTIADQWQHKGLGTLLMHKLIEFAQQHQVKHLYSIDLASNTHMRQLAHDLGMQEKRDPDDARQVIYSLELD